MTNSGLFLHITSRATASGVAIALLTQALGGALFAAFGVAAAATNGTSGAAPALAGILFLGFVGAVAGGLLAIPSGVFVGVTGGLVMSVVTRLFFFPPRNERVYPAVVGAVMAAYTLVASWLGLMSVCLLFSRDHAVEPSVSWIALMQAALAGGLGYFVAGAIGRSYLRAAAPSAPAPAGPAAGGAEDR